MNEGNERVKGAEREGSERREGHLFTSSFLLPIIHCLVTSSLGSERKGRRQGKEKGHLFSHIHSTFVRLACTPFLWLKRETKRLVALDPPAKGKEDRTTCCPRRLLQATLFLLLAPLRCLLLQAETLLLETGCPAQGPPKMAEPC